MKPKSQESRKPYKKPTLRVYGDIRTITQTVPAGAGARDRSGGGNLKTHA